MENQRYNHLNNYLKEKFGERVLKICVNGGFTCPNRDGTKGIGGCLFCSGLGSGEHLSSNKSITEQLEEYFSSYKADRANKFIVYFQSFSNTYADVEHLRKVYAEAISDRIEIVGLEVATRPDCVTEEICLLLNEFKAKVDVVVELGLQTASNEIGNIINRCYTTQDFITATTLLNKYNIETVAHVMVGLPTQTHEDIVDTINLINSSPVKGIKIHSTYVVKGTGLEKLYCEGSYTPPKQEEYLNELKYIITHLRPDIVLHRLTSDPPKDIFIAPDWNLKKKPILNGIEKILKEENLKQGIFYIK